jgi:hypothetical protein
VPLSLAACNDPATAPARDVTAEAHGLTALAAGSPRDIAAMEAIVATFNEAWTSQDPTTYAAQYAGAEWISPSGDIQTNPDVITGIYTFLLTASPLAGSVRESTIRNLTFLTGTIAVLDIDARVTGFANVPGLVTWQPGIIRVLEKNVVVKREGVWRIIKHQQTSVAPAG